MKVKILRGISGSGKSTYVKKLREDGVDVEVCSADHFFMEEDGSYVFDPSLLPRAHAACLRKFLNLVRSGHPSCAGLLLLVDNTNTTAAEIAPYYAVAEAYGFDVEIIEFVVSVGEAAARNVHGVPVQGLERQAMNMCQPLPPWWRVVPGCNV
jgi:hypothetical protein